MPLIENNTKIIVKTREKEARILEWHALSQSSEPVGKKDGKPQSKACDHHDIKIDHCRCGTDRSQSHFSIYISNNKRVRPVVELLQDPA